MSELNAAFEDIPTVELTGADGQVYRFRYGAILPHNEAEYAVLLEMDLDENGEEQVLVTRIEKTEDGKLTFVVEEDEAAVRAVFDKYEALNAEFDPE